MNKYEYKKEGQNHYSIGDLKTIEELQDTLKALGLKVIFHPTHLKVVHRMDEEEYNYFKEVEE